VKGVWELVSLYELAEDLYARMNDPMRLFSARGDTLIKEEEDRRRVNTIPKKSQARRNSHVKSKGTVHAKSSIADPHLGWSA
jgi:hypothetical protein